MRARAGTPRRRFAGALLAGVLLALSACGPSARSDEADRQAIQQLLAAYLPALAQAYATGDTEPLKAYAVPKEVLTVDKKIRELAGQGREVHPVLKRLTLDRVDVYQYANAFVSTSEVWDVTVYAAGSDRKLSEQTDQVNLVRYQLKRIDDAGWQILYRELSQGAPAG